MCGVSELRPDELEGGGPPHAGRKIPLYGCVINHVIMPAAPDLSQSHKRSTGCCALYGILIEGFVNRGRTFACK